MARPIAEPDNPYKPDAKQRRAFLRQNRRAIAKDALYVAFTAAKETKMVVQDVSRTEFGARQYEYGEKPLDLVWRISEAHAVGVNPEEIRAYLQSLGKLRDHAPTDAEIAFWKQRADEKRAEEDAAAERRRARQAERN